jgi:hypothetical protein
MTPHSLGKLIEWKLIIVGDFRADSVGVVYKTPHSLGKLIEWKQENLEFCHTSARSPPAGEAN